MTNWKLAGSTALALIFSCAVAQADVTPEEVWANWQAISTSMGQQVTAASTARNGDTLEVSGVTMAYKNDAGVSASTTIDKMNFKDLGDGTVEFTVSDSYPVMMVFPPADGGGEPGSLTLTIAQPGVKIIASGTTDATNYDIDAPTVSMTISDLKDGSGEGVEGSGDVTLTGVTARYLVTAAGDAKAFDSTIAVTSVAINFSGKDANASTEFKVAATLADFAAASKGNFLNAEAMADMAAALKAGFALDSNFSFGALTFTVDATDAGSPTTVAGTATGGGLTLAMDASKVNYGSALNGAALTVSGGQIPFPQVVITFAESAISVLMPVAKSDTPQDLAFLTKLVDFTISDEVWGMVDPAGQLPHDPATIILDAKGTGFWKQDIMDPNATMADGGLPGELATLDLTQVLLKAVGAEASATGSLTFDNTDLTTFQGFPAPTGVIEVSLKGINGLIDKLIAMGLVPEDQAMGARMMLGIFARPGAGPDELTSTIEFKDKGLFANGQQLQ